MGESAASTGAYRTCSGCGNDLDGDNLCMVSACAMEGVTPYWCDQHDSVLSRCHAFGRTHVVSRKTDRGATDA